MSWLSQVKHNKIYLKIKALIGQAIVTVTSKEWWTNNGNANHTVTRFGILLHRAELSIPLKQLTFILK